VTNSIMWFRRDLRLADNHALAAALVDAGDGGGGVIPLFVVDDRLWKPAGVNRRWFLAGCLARSWVELFSCCGGPHAVVGHAGARLAGRRDDPG